MLTHKYQLTTSTDDNDINKAYSIFMVQFLKASSSYSKCWQWHFPLRQSPGNHCCPYTTWQVVFTLKSKGGIEFLSSSIIQMYSRLCLDLNLSHILHWGETSRGSEAEDHSPTCLSPASYCDHSMSGLCRLSSSSDTVRFPRYQNIQKTRLRKISRGPDSTKKSQKLKGAKIPTKKRTRPTTSRITASDTKRMVNLPCSMARPGEGGQVDVVWRSDGSESESLHKGAFLSSGSLSFHRQHTLHFFHSTRLSGRTGIQPLQRVELLINSSSQPHSPSFLCRADLFCTFHVTNMTHQPIVCNLPDSWTHISLSGAVELLCTHW